LACTCCLSLDAATDAAGQGEGRSELGAAADLKGSFFALAESSLSFTKLAILLCPRRELLAGGFDLPFLAGHVKVRSKYRIQEGSKMKVGASIAAAQTFLSKNFHESCVLF
jgi:hypothetical protein